MMVFPFLFALAFFVFALCAFAFWIWMLVDCLTKERPEGNDKIVWVLVIIFTNIIGALIYFLVRRPERRRIQPAKQS